MLENSRSERGKGNPSKDTRTGVYKVFSENIESQKYRDEVEERKRKNLKEIGNGKYVNDGASDRVNFLLPKNRDYPLFHSDADYASYNYGYNIVGEIRLYAVIDKMLKEERYEDVMAIGEVEYENGIIADNLKFLCKIESYMIGYNKVKRRGRR